MQAAVERFCRFAIVAERLLDDQARVRVEPAASERGDDDGEQARRNGEIVQRPLRGPERLLELGECLPDRRSRRRHSAGASRRRASFAGSAPPWLSMLALARAFKSSTFQPLLATPTIGTLTPSSPTRPRRAGKICLKARSPEAPKNTRASDWAASMLLSPSKWEICRDPRLFRVENSVGVNPLRARPDSGRDYGRDIPARHQRLAALRGHP